MALLRVLVGACPVDARVHYTERCGGPVTIFLKPGMSQNHIRS